jgi:hypothetical protein
MTSPFIRGSGGYGTNRCRERAEQLREMAQDPAMEEWHEILLRLAASYDDMARPDGDPDSLE